MCADVWLWSSGWGVCQAFPLSRALWEDVTVAPTLQGWGVRSPSPRAEHYTHYLGFFCMRCVSSPHLLIHHFYISWIYGCLLYTLCFNPTLISFVPIIGALAIRSAFRFCPCNTPPALQVVVSFRFGACFHFLTVWVLSARVTIAQRHGLGGLKNRHLWRLDVQGQGTDRPLSVLWTAASLCPLCSLLMSLIRTPVP